MNAEIQKAVYQALSSAAIPGVVRIRDTPVAKPSDADFPFIEIGGGQALPADAGGDSGLEEYIDLHVWSRSGGQRQVKEIMTAAKAALHQQSFTVSGLASAHCWLDSERVIAEADGLTRHGVMTMKIIHRA